MKTFSLDNENKDEFCFEDFDLFDLCELNELLGFADISPLNRFQLKQLTSYKNLFFVSKGNGNTVKLPLSKFVENLSKDLNSIKTLDLLNKEVVKYFNEVWSSAHSEKKT